MIRGRLLATAVLLAGSLAVPAFVQTAHAAPPAFTNADGITVVSATADGPRLWRLVVSTAALSKPVRVNVLLPEGYADSTTRYPVLYLFHGTSGGANDWVQYGNAAAATDPYPMIVVMPDAGYDGDGGSWFTNWVDQHTALGAANWETFHVDQLVPWVDGNMRTIANRNGRAIAGLSQGGFGSFSYAARHPDTFASAGSFSGAPDIASNPITLSGAAAIISATAVGLDGVEPNAMFGNAATDTINWRGHDPATLVTNLGHTTLDLWSGNGLPGPLDNGNTAVVQDGLIEGAAHESSVYFAQAAHNQHVAYTFDDYGNGTHSWPYWTRDLAQYLPLVMDTFAHPAVVPASITYRSIDKTWTQWGWTVVNTRVPVQAFSGLVAASVSGFTVTAPNATAVSTPALYLPGAVYRVTASGGTVPSTVTVSADGRITVHVKPGFSHTSVTVKLTAL